MDLQIITDAETFLLSDYDVHVKDFIVSSISLISDYGEVEGRSGQVDYGATYDKRLIKVPFYIDYRDNHDFSLLRDIIFSLVVNKQSFYIREMRRVSRKQYSFVNTDESPREKDGTENRFVGGKRYKVRIANQFNIEQFYSFGEGELEFETTELPFAESIGTSADIDNPELIPLIPDLWEQGTLGVGGGNLGSASNRIRLKDYYAIAGNREYKFNVDSDYDLRITFYDRYKNHISGFYRSSELETFKSPENAQFYRAFMLYLNDDDLTPNMVGNALKPSLKKSTSGINSNDELWGFGMGLIADDDSLIYTHAGTEFKVFNPGVEVHPFEQDLTIEISDVVGSTSYLQLENQTTGDVFRVTEAVNDNQLIKLDGPNITSNNLQYLRKTNRKYITLAPGWNNFKITGATSAKVSIDTRFYYL